MSSPKPLEYGKYYHIYNRGNNRENLFVEERNYRLFLQLYTRHIVPIANTFAYVLLRNHFHFLLKVKTVEEQLNATQTNKVLIPTQQTANQQDYSLGNTQVPKLLNPSKQFSNLFNSYARKFNITYKRSGTLFQQSFGRIEITSDRYFRRVVTYIHQNPLKHGFVQDFRDWPYSSFHTVLSMKQTLLCRDDVLSWFDNRAGFEFSHTQIQIDQEIAQFFPEDFD